MAIIAADCAEDFALRQMRNEWTTTSGRGSRKTLTVTIAIVRGDFLPDTDVLKDTEGDVPPFTEEFDIMVAIMLWRDGCTSRSMDEQME